MALRFYNFGKKKQGINKNKEVNQMASFQIYQSTLKTLEGGYQAIVADSGNYNSLGQLIGTSHGISAVALEKYLGRVPGVSDMKNLSYSTALIIFENEYWDMIKGDYINSQAVAETIVDHAVNSGRKTTVRIVQTVLNQYFGKNLVIDGDMGPITLAAVNSVNANDFFVKFSAAREAYYRSLSKFSIFGTSWLGRIQTIAQKFNINLKKAAAYGFGTILILSVIAFLIIKKSQFN